MSVPLAAVLEQCRAHRAALVRHVALPPDSLHRVLRCARCQAWNVDTRVYEGFLQLADGAERPCADFAELRAFVENQHRALHKIDRLDACPCGAPAVTLALVAARFFHAMPGSGAELVVEVAYERDRVAGLRVGRCPGDGAVSFIDGADDASLHALFGVPLTLWHLWKSAVASEQGAVTAIEEGLALAAFSTSAESLRRDFDAALASDPDLRAYGLSARVVSDPAWRWLREDPNLAARPDTALVMLLRHDVLAARLALLAAARGVAARRDGDTVWLEDGLARWPVELAVVAEEGLRRGFALSTMAAASLAHTAARLDTLRSFFEVVERLRPGVQLAVHELQLTLSRDGVAGRPIDLRVAPFGATPDPEALDRDLRFYLQESPAWSDPWRVCPCGAARVVAVRRWPRAALGDVGVERAELVLLDDAPDAADTVRVLGISCDRHVEHGLRPLLDAHPRALDDLLADAAHDRDRLRFALRVASHRDGEGRAAALVEASDLLDVTVDPGLIAGLVAATLGGAREARVLTLSRSLAVVAERDADPALVRHLEEAGVALWTITHGAPPVAARAAYECDNATAPRGRFVRLDGDEAVAAKPKV